MKTVLVLLSLIFGGVAEAGNPFDPNAAPTAACQGLELNDEIPSYVDRTDPEICAQLIYIRMLQDRLDTLNKEIERLEREQSI